MVASATKLGEGEEDQWRHMSGIYTPCVLEGQRVYAFVDSGASVSFVSKSWVEKMNWKILPRGGVIEQCDGGSAIQRTGIVEGLLLENGDCKVVVTLEVIDLSGDEEMIIGMDLFPVLGFTIRGIPFTWPSEPDLSATTSDSECMSGGELPPGVDESRIADEWKQVLADNAAIPKDSVCKLPNTEVVLNTGDAKPIWVRQYKIPEGWHPRVTEIVNGWFERGLIQHAPPSWNNSLVVAPKSGPNGEKDIRVCLDARRLNAILLDEMDSSIPLIQDVIDKLSFEWISTIDAEDFYTQFMLCESDREKTAFTWNGVQYMFCRAIWGIRVMAGHVQRVMERLLSPIGLTPYQDDVPVPSKTTAQHIQDVKVVLEKLTYEAGLRIKVSKCRFFQREAKVLGFIVSHLGTRMDPAKVEAIQRWDRPADAKGLQRFLGAVNYNRCFSEKFAVICAPLDECRNISGSIEWTPDRIAAFEQVKALVAEDILLRRIDWTKDLVLTTDASLIGIGAWLGQYDSHGRLWPVYCVSKKMTPTQTRWSATKRELYALMWAMEKLRYYLLGRRFVVRVDHKPLVAMLRGKVNTLMEGWFDTIMSFDFVTEYLPGEENDLADSLSRGFTDAAVVQQPWVHKLTLTATESERALLWQAEKRGKRVPDEKEQQHLIERIHQLGHYGVESMFRTLWNEGVWWPGMRAQLRELVASCFPCQRFDVKREGFHPARSIEADRVWDHVEVDLIGPLPMSESGHMWVMTVVDVLSGYTVLRALKSKEMSSVARKLWRVICEYGSMKILQSDNGAEFVNELVKTLTTLFSVEHRLITAYNPRADGLVERTNKEVSRALKKFMSGREGAWPCWLPLVQMGISMWLHTQLPSLFL